MEAAVSVSLFTPVSRRVWACTTCCAYFSRLAWWMSPLRELHTWGTDEKTHQQHGSVFNLDLFIATEMLRCLKDTEWARPVQAKGKTPDLQSDPTDHTHLRWLTQRVGRTVDGALLRPRSDSRRQVEVTPVACWDGWRRPRPGRPSGWWDSMATETAICCQ